jgi:hypothetical protein
MVQDTLGTKGHLKIVQDTLCTEGHVKFVQESKEGHTKI